MHKSRKKPRAVRCDSRVLSRLIVNRGGREQTCLCTTINLSTTGALVETSYKIADGTRLKYRFSVPGLNFTLHLNGRVARVKERAAVVNFKGKEVGAGTEPLRLTRLNHYGITFEDVKESELKMLERYIKRIFCPADGRTG